MYHQSCQQLTRLRLTSLALGKFIYLLVTNLIPLLCLSASIPVVSYIPVNDTPGEPRPHEVVAEMACHWTHVRGSQGRPKAAIQ